MNMIPIKIERREPIMRWIPCSERLPDVSYDKLGNWSSQPVLLSYDPKGENRWGIGVFNPTGFFEGIDLDAGMIVGSPKDGYHVNGHVIAWMPLPEVYKGETDG